MAKTPSLKASVLDFDMRGEPVASVSPVIARP